MSQKPNSNGAWISWINVSNGLALRNDRNNSRYNQANVSVFMNIVELLITHGITKKITCAVLTTYAQHKKAYVGEMMALSRRLEVPWGDMVKIATIDTMQGHGSGFCNPRLGRGLRRKILTRLCSGQSPRERCPHKSAVLSGRCGKRKHHMQIICTKPYPSGLLIQAETTHEFQTLTGLTIHGMLHTDI